MGWNQILWNKYLGGNVTESELNELMKVDWEDLVPLITAPGEGMPDEMAMRIQEKLMELTSAGSQTVPVAGQGRSNPVRRLMTWLTAASVILLGAGALFYYFKKMDTQDTPSMAWDRIENPSRTPRLITLSDHTHIWLNHHAVLFINKAYASDRLVRLEGEAYFDVKGAASTPFKVLTGRIETTVLGTDFNVDNPGEGAPLSNSLVRGRVKVNDGEKDAAFLAPGEMITATTDGRVFQKGRVGVYDAGAWVNGDLVLNELPLKEALSRVQDYYGLTIKADSLLLKDKYITASYHKDEPWDRVLSHLLFVYHLTYKVEPGKQIQIVRTKNQ